MSETAAPERPESPPAPPSPFAETAPAPSPAGPAPDDGAPVRLPPAVSWPRPVQTVRFSTRQLSFVFRAQRELGDPFRMHTMLRDEHVVVTSHPDHVKSLFTAKPEHAPSLTGESPLRPIVGPNSVLTATGPRHLRQRKLLLPPFHGEAVARYAQMIAEAADREIDGWPVGKPFALAPRMQAITLDVIMAGIFGIEAKPTPGTPEFDLRRATRRVLAQSMLPGAKVAELFNLGTDEPVGIVKAVLAPLDRATYAVIAERRADAAHDQRHDILSLLLDARTEEGEALTDQELRDELLTLVLAGHETTANSLAWTFERLLRTPEAYDRLRDVARSEDDADGYVEATVHEGMRARPVIPIIGRRVTVPWQLGEFRLPPDTPVLMSIALLHHRPDVHPDPFAFRPERFVGRKPGTYTWIPFGGGIRRCLGAALAMAEQRVVLRAIARRTDLHAPDPRPERARHRNVTMIPQHGTKVVLDARTPATGDGYGV
jgi:cytochrome P450